MAPIPAKEESFLLHILDIKGGNSRSRTSSHTSLPSTIGFTSIPTHHDATLRHVTLQHVTLPFKEAGEEAEVLGQRRPGGKAETRYTNASRKKQQQKPHKEHEHEHERGRGRIYWEGGRQVGNTLALSKVASICPMLPGLLGSCRAR